MAEDGVAEDGVAEGGAAEGTGGSLGDRPSEPASGGERAPRPLFAAEFPRDPQLDALVAAFEAGDFARVREGAHRIASSGSDEAVKGAAKLLLARTRPDPLATLLLAISAVLLVLLSAWWITHDGRG